jgi:hypothetical protein
MEGKFGLRAPVAPRYMCDPSSIGIVEQCSG